MSVITPLFRYLWATTWLILFQGNWQGVACQNLVPNPSFEITGTLPCSWVTSASTFSNAVSNWRLPTHGTPDVHATIVNNNCWNAQPNSNYGGLECWRGGQTPRTGQVMIGLFTVVNAGSWREYIQVKFSSPMIPGQSYDIGFYTSLANSSSFATNNLGIHLSTVPISGNWGHLAVSPQIVFSAILSDTSNWTWVGATIVANTAFEYITIGNFSTNANTTIDTLAPACDGAYYFIDDVCVSPSINSTCASILDPQQLNFSATPADNQIISSYWEVANNAGISHFQLQRSSGGKEFSTIASIDVKADSRIYHYQDKNPVSGKSFYRLLQADQNGVQYLSHIQAVYLKASPSLSIFPNPAIDQPVHLLGRQLPGKEATICIADLTGKILYKAVFPIKKGNLSLDLNSLIKLTAGAYLITCKGDKVFESTFLFVN